MAISRPNPLIRTCLAPTRFAEIMGVTPPHFWGAAGTTYFPTSGNCNRIFYHWAWQNSDTVGRLDITRAIATAENDIENELGWPMCPRWIEDEVHGYPQPFRRNQFGYGMLNVRGQNKSVKLKRGKFIQGGQRATGVVSAGAAVVYSDEDGDGYDETATIAVATTLTNRCEIKCYFAGHGGDRDWEVRIPRSVTLSGGTITFVFDAWLLLDPDLQTVYPQTGGVSAIDLEDSSNYETTVDMYREYNDFTQAAAQFFWEPQPISNAAIVGLGCSQCGGAGCIACSLIAQNGCVHVRDTDLGAVVPQTATYNSTTGQWDQAAPSVCRDPDQVKFWYYAGDLSNDYLSELTCDPLSQYWAETIAWMATARLRRNLCDCDTIKGFSEELQKDLAFSSDAGSYILGDDDLNNPFGSRVGEVRAWHRVSKLTSTILAGGGAV